MLRNVCLVHATITDIIELNSVTPTENCSLRWYKVFTFALQNLMTIVKFISLFQVTSTQNKVLLM